MIRWFSKISNLERRQAESSPSKRFLAPGLTSTMAQKLFHGALSFIASRFLQSVKGTPFHQPSIAGATLLHYGRIFRILMSLGPLLDYSLCTNVGWDPIRAHFSTELS